MSQISMPKPNTQKTTIVQYEKTLRNLKVVSTAALVIGIVAIFTSIAVVIIAAPYIGTGSGTGSSNAGSGSTLAGIDQPLNSTSLAIINNAPNSYFEQAGEMYLNGTLSNPIFVQAAHSVNAFVVDGKPSVVYYGSITCIWCGENRWSMALALSRFGSFSSLYTGYSSLGDGDVPTLYWNVDPLNASTDVIRSNYSSSYINFLPIEDVNPITGGFALNPESEIKSNIHATGDQTYIQAFEYLMNITSNKTTAFEATPYTVWGNYQFSGADAEAFGNTTPTGSTIPLSSMTHGQVFAQLANPSDQFAWTEYAGADIYIAAVCKSISNSTGVCNLPAIQEMETLLK